MVMRSQNSNSKWVSQKFTQENGENNWNQYQVVLNGGARKLEVRDSDNTATNLTTTWPVLETGQKAILTTDYSTFVNETIGNASGRGASLSTLNILNYTDAQCDAFTTYSTGSFLRINAYGGMADIHPEGTRAWFGSWGGVIVEYVFSTPWDASTATLSGNTFTSPENKDSWGDASPAFCWADDGRVFIVTGYPGMTTGQRYFTMYRASTPYDLGSLDQSGYSTAHSYTDGHLTKYVGADDRSAFLKMSRDGYKFVVGNGLYPQYPLSANYSNAGAYPITMTLNSPFNLNTIDRFIAGNTTYLSNTSVFNAATSNGYNMTHDGRFITQLTTGVYQNGTVSANMQFSVYSLGSPWDISTVNGTASASITFPHTYPGYTRQVYNNSFNTSVHGVSPCGRYLVYMGYNSGATSLSPTDGYIRNVMGIIDLKGLGWDLGNAQDIDISGHSLGSKPVAGWTQAPKIYVSAESSSARCAVDPVSLAYWKDSSSTSSLVIGAQESGVLKAGDTLLLDDTSTVTISSVVESAGAYTYINPAVAGSAVTGKIHYTGRSFATGLSPQESTLFTAPTWGHCHGKMWFSPDGRNLYVTSGRSLGNNSADAVNQNLANMIVRYKLSTPWNIDTCTRVQNWDHGYLYVDPFGNFRTHHYHVYGGAFNDAGTKLILYTGYNSGGSSTATAFLQEWNFGIPWDLNTAVFQDIYQLPTAVNANYGVRGQMAINSTGTQVLLTTPRMSTSGTTCRIVIDLPTPYSVNGISAPPSWSSVAIEQGGFANCVTNNGKYWITSCDMASSISDGNGSVLSVQTWGTPNDLSGTSIAAGTRNTISGNSVNYGQVNNTDVWGAVYDGTANSAPLGVATSADDTILYVFTHDGTIRQFDVRLNNDMYKYTVTIPTQASVPDTVVVPARTTEVSYTSIALDPNDSDVLVLSTDEIAADSSTRAIQFKIEENAQESLVNSVKINLWRA